ncbi:YkuS family protein [Lysinibacillus sp. 54212]|uniref:YkuS family protein n=1 Tax=Lysinibacillus sp. 54212 TaxID=3119829 RepID=UPI002FCA3C87
MSRIIGVEQSLTNVEDALKAKGYEVIQLRHESDSQKCDACIITGQDKNFMGMNDTSTKGPVIDANGLSADEVIQRVDHFFN